MFPQVLWFPRIYADLVKRLLRLYSRNSEPIPLGMWTPSVRTFYSIRPQPLAYRDFVALGVPDLYPGRQSWRRARVPLFGNKVKPVDGVYLPVPAVRFAWANPEALPSVLPHMRFGPPRNRSVYEAIRAPLPQYELLFSQPPPVPQRAAKGFGTRQHPRRYGEQHRRRHDSKIPGAINRLYRFGARLNTPSETYEFWSTVLNNYGSGAIGMSTALAINEAIDHLYGARARFLKKHVYRQHWWTLPVGYDTLSRLWRD